MKQTPPPNSPEQEPELFRPYTYRNIPAAWRGSVAMATEYWSSIMGNQAIAEEHDDDLDTRASLISALGEPPMLTPKNRDKFKRHLARGMLQLANRFNPPVIYITNDEHAADVLLRDAAHAMKVPQLNATQVSQLLFPLNLTTASPRGETKLSTRRRTQGTFTAISRVAFEQQVFGETGNIPEHLAFLTPPVK